MPPPVKITELTDPGPLQVSDILYGVRPALGLAGSRKATVAELLSLGSGLFDPNGAAAVIQSTLLQRSANLSDLDSVPDARDNLGLDSAALAATSAFETAGNANAARIAAQAASDPLGAAAAVQASFGGVVTGWTDDGPIIVDGFPTNPTKGTTSIDSVKYRRVGNVMHAQWTFQQIALGGGNPGLGTYGLRVPGGLSIDTSLVAVSTGVVIGGQPDNVLGSGFYWHSSANVFWKTFLFGYDATHLKMLITSPASYWTSSGQAGFNASQFNLYLRAAIPIQGW